MIKDFSEATVTRGRERPKKRWDAALEEVDEIHHLGILRSVAASTVDRTNK